MKTLIRAVTVAAMLSAPVFAFAQSNGPVTRAQVKTELSTLEAAGYKPASNEPDYPANLQAAEQKVQTQSVAQTDTQGFGRTIARSSQSGAKRALPGDRNSIYFGD
jgi:hypothetical protein